MEGKTVSHYRVLEKIGEGGMGEVYLAQDTSLERKVALKFLPEVLQQDEIAPQRFLREARSAAAIDHPFICKIYEIGQAEERSFIAMEYVEGETLEARLKKERFSCREVLRIGSEIAEALQRAHQHGIVHRDLKPSNIMLTTEGRVKVMDFGLAKKVVAEDGTEQDITAGLTKEGTTLGTLAYMSPEQLRGEKVDARSDIFSLGVLLFEMLTGQHPFRRAKSMETSAAILAEEPAFPTGSQAGQGITLHPLIQQMLVKDPQQRCHTVEEVHTTLRRMLEEATPVHWTRKWQYWAAGTASAALLVVGLVYLFVVPPATPKATNPQSLTTDGRPKAINWLVTDERRVYYSEVEHHGWIGRKGVIRHVSVNGGESVDMTPWGDEDRVAVVMDISPDLNQLLVMSDLSQEWRPNHASLWLVPLPAGTPRRVGQIRAARACFSPSGQEIAYTTVLPKYTISVALTDGSDARPVIIEKEQARVPWIWSWSSEKTLCYGFAEFSQATGELWEIDLDGTNQMQLIPTWKPRGPWFARTTPDHRWMVFTAKPEATEPFTRRNFWAISREDRFFGQSPSEPVQISSGWQRYQSFTLTPDGQKILAQKAEFRGEVLRHRPEIDEWIQYLETPEKSITNLSFAPDGQWMAYVQYPTGTLWRSRRGGTQPLRLTDPNGMFVHQVRWSPDGNKIAFLANRSLIAENLRAYVVSRDEPSPKQVLVNEEYHSGVCWSREGKLVVATEKEGGTAPLSLIDLETHQVEAIPDSEGMWDCAWSPDGSYLATHKARSSEVVLFDAPNQKWVDLGGCVGGWLEWSPDSDYLYFLRGPGAPELWRLHLPDMVTERAATVRDSVSLIRPWYGFDPDGALLMTRNASTFDIVSLDFEY